MLSLEERLDAAKAELKQLHLTRIDEIMKLLNNGATETWDMASKAVSREQPKFFTRERQLMDLIKNLERVGQ